MNVRKIGILRKNAVLGKFLRLPFRLIPGKAILQIISGPLRGQRWIKGSHNLSVILGTYERVQSREFMRSTENVGVFWDLGAHVGYYSLLFRAGNPLGEIVAFEPAEKNAKLFCQHMDLNNVTEFAQYTVAVSDQPGMLSFSKGKTSVAGRLKENGDYQVEVIRLSDWLAQNKIKAPQLIKMDIEGEEYKVLEDIKSILKDHKPRIFLSTHGREVHRACINLLKELNYSFKPLDAIDLDSCGEVLVF